MNSRTVIITIAAFPIVFAGIMLAVMIPQLLAGEEELGAGLTCVGISVLLIAVSIVVIVLQVRNIVRDQAITAGRVAGTSLVFGSGRYSQGLTTGVGVIIVRPDFVAFLPTEPIVHIGKQIAGDAAWGAAGFQRIQIPRNVPVGEWMKRLIAEHRDSFDENFPALVDRSGGFVWPREEAQAAYDLHFAKPLKRLSFHQGKARLGFHRRVNEQAQPFADEILRNWQLKE